MSTKPSTSLGKFFLKSYKKSADVLVVVLVRRRVMHANARVHLNVPVHRAARVFPRTRLGNVNAKRLPSLVVLPRADVEMHANVQPVERNANADPNSLPFFLKMNPLTPPSSRGTVSRTTSGIWTSREIHSPTPGHASSPLTASLLAEGPDDQRNKRLGSADAPKDPRRLLLTQFKDMDDYVCELESELAKKEGRIQSMEKTKSFLRTRVALLEDQIERLRTFVLVNPSEPSTLRIRQSVGRIGETMRRRNVSFFSLLTRGNWVPLKQPFRLMHQAWRAYLAPHQTQFKSYNWHSFVTDLGFGFWNAALLIPGALAFSGLAKLPPMSGLLSAVFPGFIYFLFGTSRALSVGPDAMLSSLFGLILSQEAELSGLPPFHLAFIITLMTGIIFIGLSLIRAGPIDIVFSGPSFIGLRLGICFGIFAEIFFNLLGVRVPFGPTSTVFDKFFLLFGNVFQNAHVPTLIYGLSSVLVLFSMARLKSYLIRKKYVWPRFVPVIFTFVLISSTVSISFQAQKYGISIAGEYDHSFIVPRAFDIPLETLQRLLFAVITFAILAYSEAQQVHQYYSFSEPLVHDERELFAFGMANIVASFFGCYATTASFLRSRSFMHPKMRSSLAGGISSLCVLAVFTAEYPLIYHLPRCSISAIVTKVTVDMIAVSYTKTVIRWGSWFERIYFGVIFLAAIFLPMEIAVGLCLLFNVSIITRETSVSLVNEVSHVPFKDEEMEHMRTKLDTLNARVLKIRSPLWHFNARRLTVSLSEFLSRFTLGSKRCSESQNVIIQVQGASHSLEPLTVIHSSESSSHTHAEDISAFQMQDIRTSVPDKHSEAHLIFLDLKDVSHVDSISYKSLSHTLDSFCLLESRRIVLVLPQEQSPSCKHFLGKFQFVHSWEEGMEMVKRDVNACQSVTDLSD